MDDPAASVDARHSGTTFRYNDHLKGVNTANWPDPGSAHKKRFFLDNRGEPVASSPDPVSLACSITNSSTGLEP